MGSKVAILFITMQLLFSQRNLKIISIYVAVVIFKVFSKYCCGLFVVLKWKLIFPWWLK